MRIRIDGMITCSKSEPCFGSIRNIKLPTLITSAGNQKSGFRISGEAAANPILNIINSSDVTVQGLAFEGDAVCSANEGLTGLSNSAVLSATNSTRVTIQSVSMMKNSFDGISFRNVHQGVVIDSQIAGNCTNGISISHSNLELGRNPSLKPEFDFIRNSFSGIRGAGVLISGEGSIDRPARIEENIFTENGEGVVVRAPARFLRLERNMFLRSGGGENGGHAIALLDVSNEEMRLRSLELNENAFCNSGGLDIFREGDRLSSCSEFRLRDNKPNPGCGSSLKASLSCPGM